MITNSIFIACHSELRHMGRLARTARARARGRADGLRATRGGRTSKRADLLRASARRPQARAAATGGCILLYT